MRKVVAGVICLILCQTWLQVGVLYAADEDTQASVYLVFDPETGEFITVDDPTVTAQHEAALTQEEIESVADTTVAADAKDRVTVAAASLPVTGIVAAVVAILLAGGAFAWSRRKQQNAS